MAILVNNRTQETCAAPGTGTVTLLGAVTGYRTFSAGIGANNLTYYTIADQTGSNWEVGIGTVGSGGTTLIRTTVLDSSNGGSLTNFSSGTQNVWVDYPASKAVVVDELGNILVNQSTDQGTGVLQVTGQSTFNGAVTDKSLNLQGGNNLVLNSATLVTQNITVTANTYTLSMTGTGTITLSGTSSGTLVGTGASTVVSKTFTPTAGTLTLTPTGSCTTVQLELGSVFSGYTATGGIAVTTTNNINVPSGQVLVQSGTASLPSISFGGVNTGIYSSATSILDISAGGTQIQRFSANGAFFLGSNMQMSSGVSLNWASGTAGSTSADLQLFRDAANTLAQRNSTNAQTFRLYNTYTDASNYERLGVNWASNRIQIFAENAGTGSLRAIDIAGNSISLRPNGNSDTGRVNIQVNNIIAPQTDNAIDLGVASTNRFKNAYFSGVVNTGQISTTGYTVATLPAGVVGMRAYVTNALAPAYGVAVAGGGAVTIPVFYNGTAWICA